MDRFQCGTCKKSTDSWDDVRRQGWYFVNQQTLEKDDKGVPVWAVHQGKFCSAECLEVWASIIRMDAYGDVTPR